MKFKTELKPEVVDLIKKSLLEIKFRNLVDLCAMIDDRATDMTISQLISDMVYFNMIPPVVLNPVTKCYEYLPAREIQMLAECPRNDFRRLYRHLKKAQAANLRKLHELLIERTMQEIENEKNKRKSFMSILRQIFKS